jgi:hypothetical protein
MAEQILVENLQDQDIEAELFHQNGITTGTINGKEYLCWFKRNR